MPIDFYTSPCTKAGANCHLPDVVCSASTNNSRFGICDDESHLRRPAKLKTSDESTWDLTVENRNNNQVLFKAIDFCVDVYRANVYDLDDDNRLPDLFSILDASLNSHGLIKRCEGFLVFNDSILFFEIKTGKTRSWLKDAREKLEETILSFQFAHPNHNANLLKPIISNKNRITHQNEAIQKRILKDKIGLEFILNHTISI